MPIRKPVPCEECGGSPVYHRLTYVTVVIDDLTQHFFAPGPLTRWFTRRMSRLMRAAGPFFMESLVKLGIAKKQLRPDEGTQLLAKMLWQEADVRGITVWEFRLFNLPRNMFVAVFPNGRKISYEGIPIPDSGLDRVWWMDDKGILKKKFRELGLPVARGGAYFARASARKAFTELTTTVIVKPHSGSGSRHTTLHIDSLAELDRAFAVAKQVAPFAVVEEELSGPVYRATVVDGKFVALLQRDPPHVVGDGVHTISELIEIANQNPKRAGPYFSRMSMTPAALKELSWQGLTPESIPRAGRRVTLHQKVNWSLGGTTADATDNVHPDNITLFEESARVLKASMVGIDFIIADPTRSWREQEKCGFLECNSMPFFDNHHLPFEGKPRNVAAKIWEMMGA